MNKGLRPNHRAVALPGVARGEAGTLVAKAHPLRTYPDAIRNDIDVKPTLE